MNGASCNDEVNAFNCTCADGYEGVTCENGMLYNHLTNLAVDGYIKWALGKQPHSSMKEHISVTREHYKITIRAPQRY